MVVSAEAGSFVQERTFDKECPHRIKGRLSLFLTQRVQGFQHRPIQIAGLEVLAFILCRFTVGTGAHLQVDLMGGPDQVKVFGINQIEAIAQVNDGPKHAGLSNPSALICLCPPQSQGWAILPKIAPTSQPIVLVGARLELRLASYDFQSYIMVTAMVAKYQRSRDHQRN